ncbi:ATP-dependent 6-phosphofructokinase [bacterium]|nr:ATP-dependent 6-phosphofructokinase [bacterium]
MLQIPTLGEPKFKSPLNLSTKLGDKICNFVPVDEKIRMNIFASDSAFNYEDQYYDNRPENKRNSINEFIEVAGPREKIFFEPEKISCAIVTCGGLCPGLNNVIRTLVMELHYHYRVKKIYGIKYGFAGLNPEFGFVPEELTPQKVSNIHLYGGTVLGSSRGQQNTQTLAETLEKLDVSILFSIGGDGTQRSNFDLYKEIEKRRLPISIIGIPKTIDNDVFLNDKSFGFETAFSIATNAIQCAHTEAISAYNGVGVVKLMGRNSGYIAAYAALALNEVNFVLIPEVPFDLETANGFLAYLKKRLIDRHHAVVVVAEGAGQEFFSDTGKSDASGNKALNDIGVFLKDKIKQYMQNNKVPCTVKYIDPSYIVRSVPANPNDSIFCGQLAQYAVHAGMTGKTGMIVAWRNNTFVHLPIELVIKRRKQITPESSLWLSVLEATGQPMFMRN